MTEDFKERLKQWIEYYKKPTCHGGCCYDIELQALYAFIEKPDMAIPTGKGPFTQLYVSEHECPFKKKFVSVIEKQKELAVANQLPVEEQKMILFHLNSVQDEMLDMRTE